MGGRGDRDHKADKADKKKTKGESEAKKQAPKDKKGEKRNG
jgi:hypothetical protein